MNSEEEADFVEFATARWVRLVRSAVLMGCSREEAEDVAQTTLERCFAKWSRVQAADDPGAYVNRALLNTLRSARRRRWSQELPSWQVPDTSRLSETDLIDDQDVVRRALLRLGTDQRLAVVMRYYMHLSEVQTATALGIPQGTVKSRLARALSKLETDPELQALRG